MENCSVVRWIKTFYSFWKPLTLSCRLKRRRTIQLLSADSSTAASLMVWGWLVSMSSSHIWKGSINAEENIKVLEEHLLHRRRVQVLSWSTCSPDLWPAEHKKPATKAQNYWAAGLFKNWTTFLSWSSNSWSPPRCLQTVDKWRGDAPRW